MPCIIYFLLPPLLWYLNKRLVKQPPGGSDLGNVFKVLADIFRQGGIKKLGRKGFCKSLMFLFLHVADGASRSLLILPSGQVKYMVTMTSSLMM